MHKDKGAILVKECCPLEHIGSVSVRGVQKTWSQKAMMSRFRDINQYLKKFHSETHTKLAHF